MQATGRGSSNTKEEVLTQVRSAFSLCSGVTVNIGADPATIWRLLVDTDGLPHWKSTASRVVGEIRGGHRLRFRDAGSGRPFNPTTSSVVANTHMTWSGGLAPFFKGVRTFELRPLPDGTTDFSMTEKFSGLVLPLVRRSMPDMGPVFARFAGDLKRTAEEG